jgi:hypothetical protein
MELDRAVRVPTPGDREQVTMWPNQLRQKAAECARAIAVARSPKQREMLALLRKRVRRGLGRHDG